jgi:hypothetical protein
MAAQVGSGFFRSALLRGRRRLQEVSTVFVALQQVRSTELSPSKQKMRPGYIAVRIGCFGELLRPLLEFSKKHLG